jgi:hypothetical protein
MIGGVVLTQGNYQEVVVAEKGNLWIVGCSLAGNTYCLRVEGRHRASDPFGRKLVYSAEAVQRIVGSVTAVEHEGALEWRIDGRVGDVILLQGNYKETVIAKSGNLWVVDCVVGGSTLLLRVETCDRANNPLGYKLVYDAETVQRVLDGVVAVVNEEDFVPSGGSPRRMYPVG